MTTLIGRSLSALLLMMIGLCGAAPAMAADCGAMASAALPDATVTGAQLVAADAYRLAEGRPEPSGMNVAGRELKPGNPAFCRISVTLKPSSDSDIRMELWLPAMGWNGKFLGVGNFGWGGGLMYAGMLTGLQDGYAVASNDTGHQSREGDEGGRFLLGHPEKLIDYAYRGNHVMTVDAKTLVRLFYGRDPARSYWIGCSLGGLQGLIEARRYPLDYDGIVAGAPPNPLTHFNAAQLWPGWLVAQDSRRALTKDNLSLIHAAVLKACVDAGDRAEGLLSHPDRCVFDPDVLRCKTKGQAQCLSGQQVDMLRQTYRGPVDPKTGKVIFPGPALGSELELAPFVSGKPFVNALDLFRYAVFEDAAWDWTKMDWQHDLVAADAKLGPLMSVDSDLKPFFDHGGRLLLYVGWNDYHNPVELIDFARAAGAPLGDKAPHYVRVFTIPGMNHCAGGAGCDTFNKLDVIDGWVDRKIPPVHITASRIEAGKVVRTRPLCPYPTSAAYSGSGDRADAANFTCKQES